MLRAIHYRYVVRRYFKTAFQYFSTTKKSEVLLPDKMISWIDLEHEVIVRSLQLSQSLAEISRKQALSFHGVQALGDTLLCCVLLSANLKDDNDTLQVTVQGNGGIGITIAISDNKGICRGRVSNGSLLSLNETTQQVIGNGVVHVMRNNTNRLSHPYTTTIPLENGNISSALQQYITSSEQRSCFIGANTFLSNSIGTIHAQGYLIEFLPGASMKVKKNILDAHTILLSRFSKSIMNPTDISSILLESSPGTLISDINPTFKCSCSRNRTLNSLLAIGDEELHSIALTDEGLTVKCEFCDTSYKFTAVEVSQLLSKYTAQERMTVAGLKIACMKHLTHLPTLANSKMRPGGMIGQHKIKLLYLLGNFSYEFIAIPKFVKFFLMLKYLNNYSIIYEYENLLI